MGTRTLGGFPTEPVSPYHPLPLIFVHIGGAVPACCALISAPPFRLAPNHPTLGPGGPVVRLLANYSLAVLGAPSL